MPSVYHMVHYRKFDGVEAETVLDKELKGTATLETLLRRGLNKQDSAGQTLWQRPDDRVMSMLRDKRQIILNSVADLSDAVFGELCLVQADGLQVILAMRAQTKKLSNITTAQIYSLQERTAPQGTQFVRGIVY